MISMKRRCALVIAACSLILAAAPSWAERVVVDQIGRNVTLPDTVNRVVTLQHQTLNILVQLGAQDKLVGVLEKWKKQLGPRFVRFDPALEKMATPGDLTSVNIESLIALKPDVVFIANYAPKDMVAAIEKTGIPVVAISLRRDAVGEKAKVNPTMADEDYSYNEGLKDGIRLIADVVGKQARGEELIHAAFANREFVAKRLAGVKPEQRVRAYMANPSLGTYGSGKYTGLMMGHAGALNVAAATIKGFKQVSMEQIVGWNPAVIFVQDRYPKVVDEVTTDPAWAGIAAVKDKRVYLMPEYAKAWGYPEPEALALGEMWMAKKLYPQLFADVDMVKKADEYYQKFYGVRWTQADEESHP